MHEAACLRPQSNINFTPFVFWDRSSHFCSPYMYIMIYFYCSIFGTDDIHASDSIHHDPCSCCSLSGHCCGSGRFCLGRLQCQSSGSGSPGLSHLVYIYLYYCDLPQNVAYNLLNSQPSKAVKLYSQPIICKIVR